MITSGSLSLQLCDPHDVQLLDITKATHFILCSLTEARGHLTERSVSMEPGLDE